MSAAAGVPFGTDAERRAQDGAADVRATGTSRAMFVSIARDAQRDRRTIDADAEHDRELIELEESDDEAAPFLAPGQESESEIEFRQRNFSVILMGRHFVRRSPLPCAKTQENYRRKAARMFAKSHEIGGDPVSIWTQVLAPYAPVPNSFYGMRAAASWHCRKSVKDLLSHQCAIQRQHGATSEWAAVVGQICHWVDLSNVIEGIEIEEVLEATGGTRVRKGSKRQDLSSLPNGWRDSMVVASQNLETYADAVAILAATGCRPEELCRGVAVSLDYDHATIVIRGVKVSGDAGQPVREIGVDWRSLAPSLLAKCQDRDSVMVGIWSAAGLRSFLRRVSQQVFPGKKVIVPYHFRHALAEDMREAGWPPEEIGGALGHRVGATSAHYGRRRRPGQGRGGVQPLAIVRGSIRTTHPVSVTDRRIGSI